MTTLKQNLAKEPTAMLWDNRRVKRHEFYFYIYYLNNLQISTVAADRNCTLDQLLVFGPVDHTNNRELTISIGFCQTNHMPMHYS